VKRSLAGGSRIDVEIRYEEDLILRVSDNGKGLSSEIADGGRQGHFGLRGMRERANRIGGKFSLITSPKSGTQITLRIPGVLIFQRTDPTARTRLTKLRALLGRIKR
jgi:nitrate/nitrite-specific signal transduction histidine kinase